MLFNIFIVHFFLNVFKKIYTYLLPVDSSIARNTCVHHSKSNDVFGGNIFIRGSESLQYNLFLSFLLY